MFRPSSLIAPSLVMTLATAAFAQFVEVAQPTCARFANAPRFEFMRVVMTSRNDAGLESRQPFTSETLEGAGYMTELAVSTSGSVSGRGPSVIGDTGHIMLSTRRINSLPTDLVLGRTTIDSLRAWQPSLFDVVLKGDPGTFVSLPCVPGSEPCLVPVIGQCPGGPGRFYTCSEAVARLGDGTGRIQLQLLRDIIDFDPKDPLRDAGRWTYIVDANQATGSIFGSCESSFCASRTDSYVYSSPRCLVSCGGETYFDYFWWPNSHSSALPVNGVFPSSIADDFVNQFGPNECPSLISSNFAISTGTLELNCTFGIDQVPRFRTDGTPTTPFVAIPISESTRLNGEAAASPYRGLALIGAFNSGNTAESVTLLNLVPSAAPNGVFGLTIAEVGEPAVGLGGLFTDFIKLGTNRHGSIAFSAAVNGTYNLPEPITIPVNGGTTVSSRPYEGVWLWRATAPGSCSPSTPCTPGYFLNQPTIPLTFPTGWQPTLSKLIATGESLPQPSDPGQYGASILAPTYQYVQFWGLSPIDLPASEGFGGMPMFVINDREEVIMHAIAVVKPVATESNPNPTARQVGGMWRWRQTTGSWEVLYLGGTTLFVDSLPRQVEPNVGVMSKPTSNPRGDVAALVALTDSCALSQSGTPEDMHLLQWKSLSGSPSGCNDVVRTIIREGDLVPMPWNTPNNNLSFGRVTALSLVTSSGGSDGRAQSMNVAGDLTYLAKMQIPEGTNNVPYDAIMTSSALTYCVGDFNADGDFSAADATAFANCIAGSTGIGIGGMRCDLNGDGLRNSLDTSLFDQYALTRCGTGSCGDIDFNNDGTFPSDLDVIDFFNSLSGGECSSGNTCDCIDFNRNGVFPEDADVACFFHVIAGGECQTCPR